MNKKLVKLIMESFAELNRTEEEVYKVHSMENLDSFLAKKESKGVNIFFHKEFDYDSEWFVHEDSLIRSLGDEEFEEFLSNNHEEIEDLYYKLENRYKMYYHTEIINEILKEYCTPVDKEDLDDKEILLQDVNLESIAESLSDMKVSDIELNLVFSDYGGWALYLYNGVYYLTKVE